MLQNFYDEQNDRFFIVPLRCGSSYTNQMATNLGWRSLDDVFKEYKDEKSTRLVEITSSKYGFILKGIPSRYQKIGKQN